MSSFRYAQAADAAAVHALIESAYRGPRAAQTRFSEANLLKGPRSSEAEVSGLIGAPDTRFILMEQKELLGCVLIQKSGDDAYFGMFAIDPDQQSSGLGKALMAEAERAARELWNARGMIMSVISLRDDLIEWYGRRGYVGTGRREPFPFDETTGELRNDFDLVELRKAF